ncbi:orofacial cleft 1 candidate gene 1 protein homolog [Ictalurus furcatus]|uniref:orofacial cleft 1 candidate gene 1 protein homolog n=1 Tax=Ictalurus furcatus TaxID=66913 RepID=UPI00234FC6AE|nr:orofacial cleft 1 candidate gene 1 protein homolog [Ictalurus furcatus]
MAKQQEQEEEESGMKKGIVNPVFLCGEEEDEQSCSRQRDGGREIGGDGQDSTLAAHQQQTKLEALASTRGNEGVQNYFDPWATAEGDLKQRGMSRVGAGDELELKFVHEDERGLYEKISQMLNEDEASTVIDLPGKKRTFK